MHHLLSKFLITVVLSFSLATNASGPTDRPMLPVGFNNVKVSGELYERVVQNMSRLEDERYRPDRVFLTEQQSGYWPGDTEGRTVLGLIMDAQASGRKPAYLNDIIRRIPEHLNELGYFGTIHRDSLDEQQLSGNGWVLRALCEYYRWKKDDSVLPVIRSISENLFLAGHNLFDSYPVNPNDRTASRGGASGNVSGTIGRWRVSTDIGCVFIGMDGLIQAYEITRNKKLKPVIDNLIALFLKVDPVKIKAQTHATLTAMRGLIRYAGITGDNRYIEKAAERWDTYKQYGMTENYANYNWFCRYNTWTEPCAIVDSYIVATQLWQHTGKEAYRDDAELIYYNALCHGQRYNGGFGTDTCPGIASGHDHISVSAYEAYWCCTMRGGEGLGRAVEYSAFVRGNNVALPYYRNAAISVPIGKKERLCLKETTDYPFGGKVNIHVTGAPSHKIILSLAHARWMENFTVSINGNIVTTTMANGMETLTRKFAPGDRIEVCFTMTPHTETTINADNNMTDNYKILYGPLLLAAPDACKQGIQRPEEFQSLGNCKYRPVGSNVILSPLYHLMRQEVNRTGTPIYGRRIIF